MNEIECPYCKENYELDYESSAFENEGEGEEETRCHARLGGIRPER